MTAHDRDPLLDELDPEYVSVDPLKPAYHESIVQRPDRFARAILENTALVCIDMQYLDAARNHGVFADSKKSGVPLEAQEYYFNALEQRVLPNVRRLQDTFRSCELEVIHVRIQSLTKDGRDRSPAHKRLGLLAPPGSKDAQFLETVAPVGDEVVINKTASGVFETTNFPFILRNLGIDALFVTGVYTDECVSTTVRVASDLGYAVTLVDDACATVTPERHSFTVSTLKDRYARVVETEIALKEISSRLKP